RASNKPNRASLRYIFMLQCGVHVGLDLGSIEHTVVDADFVQLAGEVLAPDGVAAEFEWTGRSVHVAGLVFGALLDAVHIKAHDAAVVGERQVAPGIEGKSRVAWHCL